MNDQDVVALARWLSECGLTGVPETEILAEFCRRLNRDGFGLESGLVILDTLHPTHEGHAVRWRADEPETQLIEYGSTHQGPQADAWRRSMFYAMLQSGETVMRRRLTPETVKEFPGLAEMLERGVTDDVKIIKRFTPAGSIGEMDCVYFDFATREPEGFSAAQLIDLERLAPMLAIAMKARALQRVAQNLVETYLGRDAGRLVLQGRIARGAAERIDAVLWFSDLQGFTRITDTAPPDEIVPLLNDYADSIIEAIHAEEGDVLKLIGDGVLAIFRGPRQEACRAALSAAIRADAAIATLNASRTERALPVTQMYVGLHVGAVHFGNIGSKGRLDFTVVGPAVNETSRIAAMCRSADQPLLASEAFAEALGRDRYSLVSVGRFALRGVGRAQSLFTIDPAQRRR